MSRKIVIVDANNACWRLFAKLPPLSIKGQPIQVVYGFLRLLRGILTQFEPNVMLVCWDYGRSEFRKKAYPNYKKHRDDSRKSEEKLKQRKDLFSQMGVVKIILQHLNVAEAVFPGVEADDIIGLSCLKLNGLKIVASSDQDMLQLVDHDVQVWSPSKEMLFTEKNFLNRVGLAPRQFLEMRALTGDKSDGIHGVAHGVGEGTAKELIKKYENIESIYAHEKEIAKKGGRYAKLFHSESREIAYRNLLLMDLRICGFYLKDAEAITKAIQKSVKNRHFVDKAAVERFFIEKSFKSLLADFGSWISPFKTLDWRRDA